MKQVKIKNPSGLCKCGCGIKTDLAPRTDAKPGYRKGHPHCFVKGHSGRISHLTYKIDNSGCWIWQRQVCPDGYGRCRDINGKQTVAHRVYYESKFGKIPKGKYIDHLCRVRACVNPDHLESVTNAENCRRGIKAKLKKSQILEIRILIKFVSFASIASHYKVHPSTISGIHRSLCWGDVR